jgi:hypothetical protein
MMITTTTTTITTTTTTTITATAAAATATTTTTTTTTIAAAAAANTTTTTTTTNNNNNKHEIKELQKTAMLDTVHIFWKVLMYKYKTFIKGTSITCTINCNHGRFTTLYTLETWCFVYIIVNTLHLAINFDAKWDNKEEIICAGVYCWCFWLEVNQHD